MVFGLKQSFFSKKGYENMTFAAELLLNVLFDNPAVVLMNAEVVFGQLSIADRLVIVA